MTDLLDMPTALQAVEEAFAALADGRAENVPRVRARGDRLILHSMSATADYLGLAGWKQYATTAAGARFHVGLYDQANGQLIALIEANRLGQLRTGAVTGLATRLLRGGQVPELGLLGSGWQAQSQLEAVVAACGLQRALVYSPQREHRERFAERMSAMLDIEVLPVDHPEDAVRDLPVVITATTSRHPVLQGQWLSPGTTVCAVGSNWLHKAELDIATVQRAGRVVCDSIACCQREAGDFTAALEHEVFDWSQAEELAALVVQPERPQSGDTICIFKSVGMAIEDVALGGKLLELARQAGRGELLPL